MQKAAESDRTDVNIDVGRAMSACPGLRKEAHNAPYFTLYASFSLTARYTCPNQHDNIFTIYIVLLALFIRLTLADGGTLEHCFVQEYQCSSFIC